ncbi:aspartate aminotransferase family protein [Oryzicola mucosus]|uniref:Aspartate aminotransferase family protein n=1 Tax=Oryzicola mucosus TaxID=2767425 RepID=A0A8J6PPH2_9HYPH|nr:aspartate aminotransferase family protein [Oryzicola mucosus]MBD0417456.1 aspartate aminotransferase family protein [Oryzicola mucosus]
MISEEHLAALSYPSMPMVLTNSMPGPASAAVIDRAHKAQSPTRPSVRGRLVIDSAMGAGFTDPDGNVFLDMSAGVAVSSVGRNHPKVVAAIREQCEKLMHSAGLVSETTVALAEKLNATMPAGLKDESFTWFGMSGSGAIETAIKFAKAITGRNQIVAFEGAYHGVFHGSLAVTTRENFRAQFGPLMPGTMHLPYPYCYRCFADLKHPECGSLCSKYARYKLTTPNTGADDVAAVIVESMQADGGYIDPPPEFLQTLREVCTAKGIILIIDEVQAGGGRTGKMWAHEHYGIVPDMMTWAKAIGGDLPLSGVTIHERFRDKLPLGSQVLTGAENALANVVAMANLDILTDPDDDLIGRAAVVGEELKAELREIAANSHFIDEVRGRGLFIGIELVSDKDKRTPLDAKRVGAILQKCESQGVRIMSCGRYGSTIRLMPPLTTTRAHLRAGIKAFANAVAEVEAE